MENPKKFILHWLDGSIDAAEGTDIEEVIFRFGEEAQNALDYCEEEELSRWDLFETDELQAIDGAFGFGDRARQDPEISMWNEIRKELKKRREK